MKSMIMSDKHIFWFIIKSEISLIKFAVKMFTYIMFAIVSAVTNSG